MTTVFTAILGGSDSLKAAPVGADRCVCFVDDPFGYSHDRGWELHRVSLNGEDPRRLAWQIRCMPHRWGLHGATVWIDASFTLTDVPRLLHDAGNATISALRHHERASCYHEGARLVKIGQARAEDVQPQLEAYHRAKYRSRHLSIACILVRDSSETARTFGERWANEIAKYRGDNTQISLDYSAWKAGTTIRALRGTRKANPYGIHDHADHRRRRRPYLVAA